MIDGKQSLKLERLQRALEAGGGTHDVPDLVEMAKRGEVQIWDNDEAIAVTEVIPFPKRTIVRIWLCAGMMDGAEPMLNEIEAFARDQGATRIEAYGREGWMKRAVARGYQPVGIVYAKEI